MEKAKLIEMVTGITCESENISFDDFLIQMSGSGEIYEGYIGELISIAGTGDVEWHEVCDYFVPIVREVLLEANQEDDKAIFIGLAESIKFAWNRLKEQERTRTVTLCPSDNANALLQQMDIILSDIRDGWKRVDHWLDSKGDLVIVLKDSNLTAGR
ncbi:hypothetical protein [uncultured Brevibacillus sp.]|uniref:hypothetical protein n=1 Tax=uncultured Brevibacillus sp. TaxID=169970 RepID=UPI002594450D|nr:hypothetical protein [uncultured Brevibacillus sp.]